MPLLSSFIPIRILEDPLGDETAGLDFHLFFFRPFTASSGAGFSIACPVAFGEMGRFKNESSKWLRLVCTRLDMLEEGRSTWEVLQVNEWQFLQNPDCRHCTRVSVLFANSAGIALQTNQWLKQSLKKKPFSQHLRLRYGSIQICILGLLASASYTHAQQRMKDMKGPSNLPLVCLPFVPSWHHWPLHSELAWTQIDSRHDPLLHHRPY